MNAANTIPADVVNLRDYEGRSALLLGKAKDNNASCAIGPFLDRKSTRLNSSHT